MTGESDVLKCTIMHETQQASSSEPLRVALLIPHLGGGGAERSTLALARGLIARGHLIDLLLLYDKIVLKSEIPVDGRIINLRQHPRATFPQLLQVVRRMGIMSVPHLRARHLQHAFSLAAYLEQEKPDLLLPTLPDAKIAGLIARLLADFPAAIIPVVRNNIMHRKPRERALYRFLFQHADHIVAVSSGVAASVVACIGVPAGRLSTIYNPVVSDELRARARETPDHPWFSKPGPPIILAAGRLSRVKDFPTLIRAFELVSRQRPLRLLILGEGSWRQRLEHMIRVKGLNESVSMPGWVDNPFAYMARAVAFVLSSRHEGLSGVLIQALACGCPCVSTDCPSGSREILDDGRVGRLVPVGDHVALATAIERTLDAPPDPAVLTARASVFSFDASVSNYDALLRRFAPSAASIECAAV